MHACQSLNGGEHQWVTTDSFDTDDNDRIVEHWDVIAGFTSPTPSGHTSIDGVSEVSEVSDLDRTQENRALVRAMLGDLLMTDGNPDTIGFAPLAVGS